MYWFLSFNLKVADVRFELYVSTTNPNVPVYYNRKEAEDFIQYSFEEFDGSAPNATVFAIPPPCKELWAKNWQESYIKQHFEHRIRPIISMHIIHVHVLLHSHAIV